MQEDESWLGFWIKVVLAFAIAIAVGATVGSMLAHAGNSGLRRNLLSWLSGISAGAGFAVLAFRD